MAALESLAVGMDVSFHRSPHIRATVMALGYRERYDWASSRHIVEPVAVIACYVPELPDMRSEVGPQPVQDIRI